MKVRRGEGEGGLGMEEGLLQVSQRKTASAVVSVPRRRMLMKVLPPRARTSWCKKAIQRQLQAGEPSGQAEKAASSALQLHLLKDNRKRQ